MLRTAKDDEAVHVVIITGAGTFFSSGADFTSPADTPLDHATAGMNARHRPVGVFMLEMMRFPKPIIAAVNGPAVGVGVTLLLHADIVYCTEDAYFWTPFTRIAVGVAHGGRAGGEGGEGVGVQEWRHELSRGA